MCGKQIMLPVELEKTICTYCGGVFITEDAVAYAKQDGPISYKSLEKNQVEKDQQSKSGVPRMMTIREVAQTGIFSEHALRRMVKEGKLPVVYVGNKELINYDMLVEKLY